MELEKLGSLYEEETALVQRCQRGSKEAFEAIVRRYMKDAYFIALGLVGNREDALDLSQEAFIRAYRNIKRFNPQRDFFPWFYQILRNLCFNHLRNTRQQRQRSLEQLGGEQITAGVDDGFVPDVVAERNEIKDRVWKAIGKLDDKHREVIILRHFQNLSYEQIAKNIFCSKGTVMSRLYYARNNLRDILILKRDGASGRKEGDKNDLPGL